MDGKEKTRRARDGGSSGSNLCCLYFDGAGRGGFCAGATSGGGKPRSEGGAQRRGEDARRSDAARGYLPAEGGGKISGAASAHALRQDRNDQLWFEGGGARICGDCAGRARAGRIGGGVVHVQARVAGRVRHGGMGGGASLFEWEGGKVWRLVRGGDAIPGGARETAAPAGDWPEGAGVDLSRRLDVSRRGVRTVVQRIVDDGSGDEHDAAARGIERQRGRLDEDLSV